MPFHNVWTHLLGCNGSLLKVPKTHLFSFIAKVMAERGHVTTFNGGYKFGRDLDASRNLQMRQNRKAYVDIYTGLQSYVD